MSYTKDPPKIWILSGALGAEAIAVLRDVHEALTCTPAPSCEALTALDARVVGVIRKAEART